MHYHILSNEMNQSFTLPMHEFLVGSRSDKNFKIFPIKESIKCNIFFLCSLKGVQRGVQLHSQTTSARVFSRDSFREKHDIFST